MVRKMSREERAKQFMPFGALKGYPEALARKEKQILPKRELSEESLEELNRCLTGIEIGETIKVLYYYQGEYRTDIGLFKGTDGAGRLRIGEKSIPLQNIYDISAELHLQYHYK